MAKTISYNRLWKMLIDKDLKKKDEEYHDLGLRAFVWNIEEAL